MAKSLHIAISPETVTTIGGLDITNTMITTTVVSILILALAFVINRSLKKTNYPTGWQGLFESITEGLQGLIHSVTNDARKTKEFFPLLAGFFFFILLNNWFGLLPIVPALGFFEQSVHTQIIEPLNTVAAAETSPADNSPESGEYSAEFHTETESATKDAKEVFIHYLRPSTSDLSMTIALGFLSVLATQYFGVKHLGIGYFSKFFNFSSPIMFFVGILELISEFAKIISFGFRLFGNIFAGKVLITVIKFLVPLVVPMPFYVLELFIGFIQALVFTMLTLVFFNIATQGHGEEH